MERRKRVRFLPQFLRFVLYTVVLSCFEIEAHRPFFHRKIGKIEFSPACNAGDRERGDRRTRETGTERQSDKRPEMHRSPEMLVDVLHCDFRRRNIDRDMLYAFPKHICVRARIRTPFIAPNFPTQRILPINLSLAS